MAIADSRQRESRSAFGQTAYAWPCSGPLVDHACENDHRCVAQSHRACSTTSTPAGLHIFSFATGVHPPPPPPTPLHMVPQHLPRTKPKMCHMLTWGYDSYTSLVLFESRSITRPLACPIMKRFGDRAASRTYKRPSCCFALSCTPCVLQRRGR